MRWWRKVGLQSGGAFLPGGDYSLTGAVNFVTAPTIGGSAAAAGTNSLIGGTAPTIASPTITGTVQSNGAAGSAGAGSEIYSSHVVVNNTVTDFFTVTVPNAIMGGAVFVKVSSTLGDGDSTDSALYCVGISRVAGAAAKAVIGAKTGAGATAGATANAVITGSVSAMSGAVGAVNTFTIQFKNARSAGAADNHPTVAIGLLVNHLASGLTIAAI
jgi:hypothetical protein